MSRILLVREFDTPTSAITWEFYNRLYKKGLIGEVSFRNTLNIKSADLSNSDVVILIRPTDSLSLRIAQKSKKGKKFVISVFDDDLMNRPYDRPIISWRRTNVERILRVSDMVLSSSNIIIEKYKGFTIQNRGFKTDTAIFPEEFRSTTKLQSDKIRLVYAANSGHSYLFEKYINPVIPMLEQISKEIEFTFVGVKPIIPHDSIPSNVTVEYIDGMSFLKYREFMSNHDYDLGFAPLESNDFTRCKYINKYLEYAIFQIPCMFSDTEPYSSVITDGVNGYLVNNTEEEWGKKILSVLKDEKKYIACGIEAMKMVKDNFNPETIECRLLNGVPELQSYFSVHSNSFILFFSKVEYVLFKLEEVLFLAYEYLKLLGITGLKKKIASHIDARGQYKEYVKGIW